MGKSCLFAAVLCTAVFASCSQDEHLDFVKDGKFNFTGVLEMKDSRTSLDGNKVVWNLGDQVSIFEKDNANALYEVDGITDGVASFKFLSYTDPTTWEDLNANYAVYPYNESNMIAADGTISAVVPAAYTFKDRASSIEDALMAAKSENTQLNFINAQGIIRLRLNAKKPTKYGKIQSIKLTSANNNLSGTATISFANTTTPSAVIPGTAGKELTINVDDAVKAELPSSTTATFAEFYVPVVPTDFAAGDLTLTVVGEKDTYVYKINAAISVGRKVIKPITHTLDGGGFSGEIDGETDEVWDGDSQTEVTPINGVYTITKASELAWMSARALTENNNIAETVTIDLQKDIDMGGFEFSSIIAQRGDKLIFQGNSHTISNMKIVSGANDNTTGQAAMFYSYPNSTLEVSNLILKDITVTAEKGNGYAAAVIGYCEGDAVLDNVDVVNAAIMGEKSSGMLVGHFSKGATLTATGCELEGSVTLYESNNEPNGHYAGKYIGTIAGAASLTNCTVNATVGGSLKADNVRDFLYGRMTSDGSLIVDGTTYVNSAAGLKNAVAAGATNIYLQDGEYDVDGCGGKTLTIKGSNNAIIKVVGTGAGEAGGQLDYGFDGSTVTFEGVTIKTNNATYAGYARLNATYIDCIFENCYCLNGNSYFTGCTFNVSGDQYNVWTWGAPEAKFIGCTFNSDGKAVLLYGQVNTKLTIDTCVFNDKGGLADKKAAIEIGNDYDKSYELIVNNTTVNGYEINDKGINTGTTLWGNKNSMGTDKLNVVVNGVDVY